MVIQLYRDKADLQNKPTDIYYWPVQYPTAGMHPQVAYIPAGVHPDLSTHIDCVINAALMTVSVLSHQPLSVLLPALVHRFRVMVAYILWEKKTAFNITTCVRQNKDMLQTLSLRRRRGQTTSASSTLITAHYKALSYNKDIAISHTYVKESTIKEAGKGLFASRVFNGKDEASAYIGEYNGGGALTHDKIYKGNRFNDYVIIHKGLIRDAWDHTRGRVQ